jgi:hypothetical protein
VTGVVGSRGPHRVLDGKAPAAGTVTDRHALSVGRPTAVPRRGRVGVPRVGGTGTALGF